MKVERTFDDNIVKTIMFHPPIWDTATEDGQYPESWEPEMHADCWLKIVLRGTVIGLYNLHAHNGVTLEIHAQLLPEFRKEHSKDSSRKVLEWILNSEESSIYQKVIAQIPALYPNVRDFTLSAGFQEEGINRQSYRKNGKLYDQWLLGITRPEIIAFLEVN